MKTHHDTYMLLHFYLGFGWFYFYLFTTVQLLIITTAAFTFWQRRVSSHKFSTHQTLLHGFFWEVIKKLLIVNRWANYSNGLIKPQNMYIISTIQN